MCGNNDAAEVTISNSCAMDNGCDFQQPNNHSEAHPTKKTPAF